MKTNRFTSLVAAAFGVAVISTAGCAEKETIAETTLPPAKEVITTTTTTVPGPATTVQITATAEWIDIKDYTYDMRARFFAGLERLEARVDGQFSKLTAKRAAMKSTTDTKDWDFAMKEMGDARSYLKSMGAELHQATPETWAQEKDKVGQAWARTQAAYDKVKASTTN